MALFPSLPEVSHLGDVLKKFPRGVAPLLQFHEDLLRTDGELSIGERELIAAFTSGLNACTFCSGSHTIYAEIFGISPGIVEALIDNIDTADVKAKLKPILHYVKKLNNLPSKLVQADANAVFDAGWSEEALFEAIQVCATFNLMNRIVEGVGVTFDYAKNAEAEAEMRGRERYSYLDFGRRIGAIAPE